MKNADNSPNISRKIGHPICGALMVVLGAVLLYGGQTLNTARTSALEQNAPALITHNLAITVACFGTFIVFFGLALGVAPFASPKIPWRKIFYGVVGMFWVGMVAAVLTDAYLVKSVGNYGYSLCPSWMTPSSIDNGKRRRNRRIWIKGPVQECAKF